MALSKNTSLDNLIYYLLKGTSGFVLIGAFWLIEKSPINSGLFSISYSRSVLFQSILISPVVSYLIRDWNFRWISTILKSLWKIGVVILFIGFFRGSTILWELAVAVVAGMSVLVESAELRNAGSWKKNWIILLSATWKGLIYIAFIYNQSLQFYVLSGGLLLLLFGVLRINIEYQPYSNSRSSYMLLIIFAMGAFRSYVDKWIVFNDVSEALLTRYIVNFQLAQSIPMLAMSVLSMKFTTALYVSKDRGYDTSNILRGAIIGFLGLVFSGLILMLAFNYFVYSIINDVKLFFVLFLSGGMFFASQILGTDLIARHKLLVLLIYNLSLSLVPFVLFKIYSVNTLMQVALITTLSSFICLVFVSAGRKLTHG